MKTMNMKEIINEARETLAAEMFNSVDRDGDVVVFPAALASKIIPAIGVEDYVIACKDGYMYAFPLSVYAGDTPWG